MPLKVPNWLVGVVVLFVVLSWLPLAWVALSRSVKSEKPPVHLFLDMDFQPRYGPQDVVPMDKLTGNFLNEPIGFADGRAMQLPVEGTVTFDTIDPDFDADDDHFYRGYEVDPELNPVLDKVTGQPKYLEGYPEGLPITKDFILRGRDRYNIYCAVCHGRTGFGDGPVHLRIQNRQAQNPTAVVGWVPPRNLQDAAALGFSPAKIYDTITRGKGAMNESTGKMAYTMWPYASQISPRDRWAIAAYVKVLQTSQFYPLEELSDEMKTAAEASTPVDRPGLTKELEVAAEGGIVLPKAPFTDADLDDPSLVDKGKRLFTERICNTCHAVDEAIPAPAGIALKATNFYGDFWGKERKVHKGLVNGLPNPELATVTLSSDYFYHSVKEPMALIVEGAIPGMAPLPTTDEEIKALAAYIKSLSKE